eukprot:scaffold2570_cov223-Alexandrium_tamarense.AAC.24
MACGGDSEDGWVGWTLVVLKRYTMIPRQSSGGVKHVDGNWRRRRRWTNSDRCDGHSLRQSSIAKLLARAGEPAGENK